jgi:hypothetical protein
VSLAAIKVIELEMKVTAQNLKFVYFVLHLLMDKRKQKTNATEKERERERTGEIHTKKILK